MKWPLLMLTMMIDRTEDLGENMQKIYGYCSPITVSLTSIKFYNYKTILKYPERAINNFVDIQ